MNLKKQQIVLLEIIIEYINEYGFSPSIRELVELTGYKSTSTVHRQLRLLEYEGYITIQEDKSRTIKVVREDQKEERN